MDSTPDESDGDDVDALLAAWRAARPDLDPSPLGLVGRVLLLARRLEAGVDAALEPFSLNLGTFDILATLRRHAPDGGLTPGRLLKSVILSSGGMTARLDRLERDGLVRREADPADRRGVIVRLTDAGRERIDAATAARFRQAAEALPPLSGVEAAALEGLLRRWMRA